MSGAQHTNTHRPPCGHPLQHSTPAYAVGRVQGQAPDVDGETLLDTADLPDCRPGDFVCATITGARGYDLLARATGREHRSPRSAPELLQIRMN